MVVVASGNITPAPKQLGNGFRAANIFRDMYNTYTCGRVTNDFSPFPGMWTPYDQLCESESVQNDSSLVLDTNEPAGRMWIPNLWLKISDRNELTSGEMLSDKHICAAQMLLGWLRPGIGGLQDPVLSQVKFEPVHSESIQIHHTRGNHWVVSHWLHGDIVRVYDTLYDDVSPDLQRQLQEIYVDAPHSALGEILYDMPRIQRQYGHKDCGVFAIAIGVELCQSICGTTDLPELQFNQDEMRGHLLDCFQNEFLKPFPLD